MDLSVGERIFRLEQEIERQKTMQGSGSGGGGQSWDNWTPAVDQGGAVAHTVLNARYALDGATVHLLCSIEITGSGSAGSPITIGGLPEDFAFTGDYVHVGSGSFSDPGTLLGIPMSVLAVEPDTVYFGVGDDVYLGEDIITLASGYEIHFAITYERVV